MTSSTVTPSKVKVALPGQAVTSYNWSGFMADAGPGTHTYDAVRAAFVQPAVSRGCQPEADLLTWVGLGGYHPRAKNRVLIQVGTVADVDLISGRSYWAFMQYLRTDLRGNQLGGSEKVTLPIRIRPGDGIWLSVTVRDAGEVAFEVRNQTTGARVSRVEAVPSELHDGSTAEFVAERTGSIRLARFGTMHWTDAAVRRAGGGWRPLGGEAGLTEIRMAAGPRTLAEPDPMSSPTAFTNRWRSCR